MPLFKNKIAGYRLDDFVKLGIIQVVEGRKKKNKYWFLFNLVVFLSFIAYLIGDGLGQN